MNPTNEQELREQIRKTSNAACNSVAEDGSFNTDEYLSEETRLIAFITAHTNAEIAKATTAARIDELEQAMGENAPFGEGQQDIAVQYIEYRIAELQAERAKR